MPIPGKTGPLGLSDWVFPSDTKSGHIERSTLKNQYAKTRKERKLAPFVPYDLRHTCLTRWAKVMDPFTPKKRAGHSDLNTTMRYVHMDDDVRAAREKIQGGHKVEHTTNAVGAGAEVPKPASDSAFTD